MRGHPDRQLVEFLKDGFTSGFDLGYSGSPSFPRTIDNFPSCQKYEHIIDEYLHDEVQAGRMWGPHDSPPVDNLQCSPMGVIPKQEVGKFRIVHNMSAPEGDSINDYIDKDSYSLSYVTVDDAIRIIQKYGPGTKMSKFDLCQAFRLLPVKDSCLHLQGIYWKKQFFIDLVLCMGLRSSPWIFNEFSSSIEWIGLDQGVTDLIHLLDDFFTAGPLETTVCEDNLELMLALCTLIGAPFKPSKTVYSTTCITFLGIVLDSIKQEARLPEDKLMRYKQILREFQVKSKVRLRSLQALLGALNFCCRVTRGGRAFLQRLIEVTRGKVHPFHWVRLNQGCKLDILMWQEFLENWNGIALFPSKVWILADEEGFSCDASGLGLAGFYKNHWFQHSWPPHLRQGQKDISIDFQELLALVVGVVLWGAKFTNQTLVIRSDNLSVVHVVNSQSSKSPRLMDLVRHLVLKMLHFNLLIKCEWVSSVSNLTSDLLSRFSQEEFRRLHPGADKEPTTIPDYIWNL